MNVNVTKEQVEIEFENLVSVKQEDGKTVFVLTKDQAKQFQYRLNHELHRFNKKEYGIGR